MKNTIKLMRSLLLFSIVSSGLLMACDDDKDAIESINNIGVSQEDKDALLFMLEEEKLARDTYEYLDNLWGTTQFTNIKASEQSHMDAVAKLLTVYDVPFTILSDGKFDTSDLQNFYDQFILDGEMNEVNALKAGATIEDLDIIDLQLRMDASTNTSVIAVFESLQCGSRNHLRSFVSAIENSGSTYVPQFLSEEEFNRIINDSGEQCNK